MNQVYDMKLSLNVSYDRKPRPNRTICSCRSGQGNGKTKK